MNTKIFKSAVITSFISSCMLMGCNSNRTNDETNSANQMNALNLTSEWDKTFPKSEKVNHFNFFDLCSWVSSGLCTLEF